jgi:hypothetical protein
MACIAVVKAKKILGVAGYIGAELHHFGLFSRGWSDADRSECACGEYYKEKGKESSETA